MQVVDHHLSLFFQGFPVFKLFLHVFAWYKLNCHFDNLCVSEANKELVADARQENKASISSKSENNPNISKSFCERNYCDNFGLNITKCNGKWRFYLAHRSNGFKLLQKAFYHPYFIP